MEAAVVGITSLGVYSPGSYQLLGTRREVSAGAGGSALAIPSSSPPPAPSPTAQHSRHTHLLKAVKPLMVAVLGL